jgi:hypothetical protein
MRDFDPNDPRQLGLYNEAMAALNAVWPAYLRFVKCVGCARRDIIAHIAGEAEKTSTEQIIGLDFLNAWAARQGSDEELPAARDGVSRFCEHCAGQARAGQG